MMRHLLLSLAAVAGLATLGTAAQSAEPARPATAQPDWRKADPGDAKPVLGPPPSAGDPMWKADGEIFQQTRRLQGSSRWNLAIADADYRGDAELKDFACPMGLDLNGRDDRQLLDLMVDAVKVTTHFASRAKPAYDRPRPYHGSGYAPCTEGDDEASYPSGHATAGWTYGLLLSELAPDRAAQIMGRARAYGESRVVCGMHWATDVEAGRRAADTAVAFLHGQTRFRDEMEAARSRLDARRAVGKAPDPARCAVEAEAVAHRPW